MLHILHNPIWSILHKIQPNVNHIARDIFQCKGYCMKFRVRPIIGYTDITDTDTDNRYRYRYDLIIYTVPNCQDDHLSQQGFFLTLRCSSDVNLDMSIWTMLNNPFIRFRCSSYEINVHPGMETWPFGKYSLHPSCQRYPSGPSKTYIICHFQASFMAWCTSARIKITIHFPFLCPWQIGLILAANKMLIRCG